MRTSPYLRYSVMQCDNKRSLILDISETLILFYMLDPFGVFNTSRIVNYVQRYQGFQTGKDLECALDSRKTCEKHESAE